MDELNILTVFVDISSPSFKQNRVIGDIMKSIIDGKKKDVVYTSFYCISWKLENCHANKIHKESMVLCKHLPSDSMPRPLFDFSF